jgi:PPK2 family polyphosphate:nucleotide phosphotransferase
MKNKMKQPIKIKSSIRLKELNPDFHEGLDKDATREKTTKLCERIGELQKLLYANARHAVLILLQGMDASGKDGTAKRVLEFVNPLGTEAVSFKAPSREDLAHDYLWRIHKMIPRYGQIGVFNRSHYEDVLVVRVMKLQPRSVWSARYDQINAFEKMLGENNVIVLKFFLHISKDEQAERLQARIADPKKNWKFDPGDLEMRKHWTEFQAAYQDVINRCSTPWAPWHVVPANHKWYRDYLVARAILKSLEKLQMRWPRPRIDLSKITVQ